MGFCKSRSRERWPSKKATNWVVQIVLSSSNKKNENIETVLNMVLLEMITLHCGVKICSMSHWTEYEIKLFIHCWKKCRINIQKKQMINILSTPDLAHLFSMHGML